MQGQATRLAVVPGHNYSVAMYGEFPPSQAKGFPNGFKKRRGGHGLPFQAKSAAGTEFGPLFNRGGQSLFDHPRRESVGENDFMM